MKTEFRDELQKLLLSIKKNDESISDQEINLFFDAVGKEIIPLENTENVTIPEHSFYTEFEYENLAMAKSHVREAFWKFTDFMKENQIGLSKRMKKAILKAASKIGTTEISENNKSAKALMIQLQKELESH